LADDRCEILKTAFEIDSVTAIREMERLGAQKPDDLSVLASDSFRMTGDYDHGGDGRKTLAGALLISLSKKALIPTKPGALAEKLTF
jgi:hypothetical protein